MSKNNKSTCKKSSKKDNSRKSEMLSACSGSCDNTEIPYLTELGIPIERQWTNVADASDERFPQWEEQRLENGFDTREIWNMDMIFLQWLYTRTRYYKEHSPVDLDFSWFEWKGKSISQREAIDKIIDWTEYAIKHWYDDDERTSRKVLKKAKKATLLWAEIMPAMWY